MEKVGFEPGALRCCVRVLSTGLFEVDRDRVDESFKYF